MLTEPPSCILTTFKKQTNGNMCGFGYSSPCSCSVSRGSLFPCSNVLQPQDERVQMQCAQWLLELAGGP